MRKLHPALRLAARLRVDAETGCHVWTGARNRDGYGTISVWPRKTASTHVLAWEVANGPVGPGLELDHICRNRACCNPEHLQPVSHRENMLRGLGVGAENAAKTHCQSGHPLSPDNTYYRPNGCRQCRACGRAAALAYRRRRAA